ncbi:MAG: DUF58 domain-containing protein [Armatimonadota bacterium]
MGTPTERTPKAPPTGGRRYWYAGTQDIEANPLFKGKLSQWLWRFITHRLTPAGRWFFWPTLVLVLVGSLSLEWQPYVVFLYAAALWLVALLTAVLRPPRVSVQSHHAERVCAGEVLPVEVTIEQQGRAPGTDLQVLPERLPPGLAAVPAEGVPVPTLEPGERARVWLGLHGARRGVYALPGYRVESDFPFGLVNAYRFYPLPRRLLVYPRFTPLTELILPTGFREQPGGVALKARQGDSFELLGNRDYRAGDNIRNIDWRATARLREPVVREYTQEYFMRVGVILDTQVRQNARPAEQDNFERAVSLSAAVSDFMARRQYLVDIFAAGDQLHHLTAGQSITYLDQILDILACVESYPKEPFATLEPEIGPLLGKLALVICVLLDWNEARRQFVEHLVTHGVAVKVIIARATPCTLDPDGVPGVAVVGKAEFAAGADVL